MSVSSADNTRIDPRLYSHTVAASVLSSIVANRRRLTDARMSLAMVTVLTDVIIDAHDNRHRIDRESLALAITRALALVIIRIGSSTLSALTVEDAIGIGHMIANGYAMIRSDNAHRSGS